MLLVEDSGLRAGMQIPHGHLNLPCEADWYGWATIVHEGHVEVHSVWRSTLVGSRVSPPKPRRQAGWKRDIGHENRDQNEGHLLQPYIVFIDFVSYCFSN